MRCYKGIKFVNDVGTTWTAIKHINGEDWEFISNKNNKVVYNYKSFYRDTQYTLSRWKIVHNFKGDTLHILDSYKENGRYVVRYYYTRNGELFSGFTLSGVIANWWGADEGNLKRIDSFEDYLKLCK